MLAVEDWNNCSLLPPSSSRAAVGTSPTTPESLLPNLHLHLRETEQDLPRARASPQSQKHPSHRRQPSVLSHTTFDNSLAPLGERVASVASRVRGAAEIIGNQSRFAVYSAQVEDSTMGIVLTLPEQRVLLRSVSWETYERLLFDHMDASTPRFTFDRGMLEIMSPSSEHETFKQTLTLLVEMLAKRWEWTSRTLARRPLSAVSLSVD